MSAEAPILALLRAIPDAKLSDRGWSKARCPAHEDDSPSFGWTVHEDGSVGLSCQAGCTAEDIVAAVGCEMKDLFVPKSRPRRRLTKTTEHEVRDASGELHAIHVRLDYSDGSKGLPWRLPGATENGLGGRPVTSLPLYGSERVASWGEDRAVVVVEGEKAADALNAAGVCALGTVTGAKKCPDADALEPLRGRTVTLWPDADAEGREHMRRLAAGLEGIAAEVRWLEPPDDAPKGWDAADLLGLADDAAEALAGVRGRIGPVPTITPSDVRATVQPPPLASTDDILGAVARTVALLGVAGEARAAKLVYLVATTRLLDRIVSLAVKGPSSAGKSWLVAAVLRLFPASACHVLSAFSERALIYDDAPLEHRMLVIYEAAGMAGDVQTYLVRSLLSEGCVRYVTVEKAKGGLKPRTIERQGPTGLITTTTELRLHPENETRLLSLTVSDSPEQTRAILLAHANGEPEPVDLAPWQRLQEWLAGEGNAVAVPYVRTLAEAIPPVAVRLRRDFPTVVSLIKAHALLHRLTREVDEAGAVVATIVDYAVVRELVADLVADAAERSVPEPVRETVAVVGDLVLGGGETTVQAVGDRLGLDKSAASRRIRSAVQRGYLKNLEDKRGRPYRLVLGEPLPAELTILPEADELERLHGCTVVSGGSDTVDPTGVSPTREGRVEGAAPPSDDADATVRATVVDIPADGAATVQPPDEPPWPTDPPPDLEPAGDDGLQGSAWLVEKAGSIFGELLPEGQA